MKSADALSVSVRSAEGESETADTADTAGIKNILPNYFWSDKARRVQYHRKSY